MPAPYNYNIAPATEAFGQSLQFVQAMQQRKAEEEKLRLAQEQARQKQEILSRVVSEGGTPQVVQWALSQMPEEQEAISGLSKTLGAARMGALTDAGMKAAALLQPGPDGRIDPTAAKEVVEQYRQAAVNSGDDQMAEWLTAGGKMLDTNPAGAGAFFRMMVIGSDPEKAKAFEERTAAMQNWDFFKSAIGEEAARRVIGADDDVIVDLPNNGGFYAGPRSGMAESLQRAGIGGGAAGQPVTVTTREEAAALPDYTPFIYKGEQFIKKPKGGPAQSSGGNFRE